MTTLLGHVEALFRHPVKSMRGESLESAALGWHGVEGDRRLALRRLEFRGGFPWLSASKLADLVRFTPLERGGSQALPTHVRTPEGGEFAVFSEELAADIGRRLGEPVEMMHLDRGIFDETPVSVIAAGTIAEVCRLAGCEADVRRFRPNVLVRTAGAKPFEEDTWVGGTLVFGESDDAAAVTVTMRDLRCVMVNLDPKGGPSSPEVLKVVARVNEAYAGVYATVARPGRLAVGQPVTLHR